ncbi:hypothetical protein JXJ21_11255 [candidate division KSB1 bacterium]|nr:hypothetical protein [candidate division KSB1 bacterium]
MPALSKNNRMTKRERVEAAMNLQETDRTPIYDILINDPVIQYLTGIYPPVGETGLKLRLEATARILDMTRMASYAPQKIGETIDEDGFVHFRQDRWIGGGIRKRPFSDVEGAKKWLSKAIRSLNMPLNLKKHIRDFTEESEKVRHYLSDDTVVIQEYGTGLDSVRYALGIELFSYLSVDEPELITEYLDRCTAREIEKIHATANPALSPCALTYGDIAYKERLLHSPEWLRREFFPLVALLNRALHEHGVKCLFHSDGYLMDVMPDLLATEIDGINPVEIVAGMDLKEVKRLYGEKIFITGGIDISQLMAIGTPEDVRCACQEAIRIASPGYFIGSTTELDNGSKLENVLAMVETAWGEPVITNSR